MHYKDIMAALGIDERELAKVFGYGGKDPRQTMWSSSPYRSGRIQNTVEGLFRHFVANTPHLTEEETEQRKAGTGFLLNLAKRNGVDLEHFNRLRDYLEQHANPEDPQDRKIMEEEKKEWRRVLKRGGLI